MKALLTWFLLVTLTTPLAAQTPADLAPLWQSLSTLAAKQGALEARVNTLETQVTPLVNTAPIINVRLGALEVRVVTLEAKPAGPNAATAFFSGLWSVLTNQVFLGAVAAVAGCVVTKKC